MTTQPNWLVALAALVCLGGIAGAEPYPRKELDLYRLALASTDAGMQQAAIRALKNYPEGFDLVSEYLYRNPCGAAARDAAAVLVTYESDPQFTDRLEGLMRAVEAADRSDDRHRCAAAVFPSFVAALYKHKPREYGPPMLQQIKELLEREGDTISFGTDVFERIETLAPNVPKKSLYALIPPLANLVERGFFSDIPAKAQHTLAVITGENFSVSRTSSKDEREAAAERYRSLYYKKLK